MRNIILIGMMGSGKTSIAHELELSYGYDFVDTDDLIVKKQGMSINEIFATQGEEVFRDMETALIRDDLAKLTNTVVSCGGGTPLRPENRELLKEAGTVVWLHTSVDEIFKRIKGDKSRPLLNCEDPESRLRDLMDERSPIYRDCANFSVFTDGKDPEEIAKEIYRFVNPE